MANERLCLMCGKRYRYCSNCRDFNQKETWRYLYHDEKCKEISNIWYDYRENQITGEVAKERFNALKPNIDDVLKHTTIAAREIQELFGVNKQKSEESEESETVEESAKVEEPKVEEEPKSENVEEVAKGNKTFANNQQYKQNNFRNKKR